VYLVQVRESLELGKDNINVAARNTCSLSSTDLDEMIFLADQTLLKLQAKLKSDEDLDEQYTEDQLKLHKVSVLTAY